MPPKHLWTMRTLPRPVEPADPKHSIELSHLDTNQCLLRASSPNCFGPDPATKNQIWEVDTSTPTAVSLPPIPACVPRFYDPSLRHIPSA